MQSFFFDLDGCIWFDEKPAPNAPNLVRLLRESGKRVSFVSNITSLTPEIVAEKLTGIGIPAESADVITPFTVLNQHPLLQGDSELYLVGNELMREALRAGGARLTDEPEAAGVVLLCRDIGVTYGDLAAACHALDNGAALLALNLDARFPVRDGVYMPGTGAIAALLTTATGVKAEPLGKPSRFFFERALARFGAERETTVMLGDNLDSDILGGLDSGLITVRVGNNGYSQLALPPVPHFHARDLFEVQNLVGLGETAAIHD